MASHPRPAPDPRCQDLRWVHEAARGWAAPRGAAVIGRVGRVCCASPGTQGPGGTPAHCPCGHPPLLHLWARAEVTTGAVAAAESASNSVIMLVTSSWVPWCGCLSCSTILPCLPVPGGVIGAAGFGVWPARDVASFPVAAAVCPVPHHRPCAVSADAMTIRGTNGCAHVQGEVRVWPPRARSDPRTQNQ